MSPRLLVLPNCYPTPCLGRPRRPQRHTLFGSMEPFGLGLSRIGAAVRRRATARSRRTASAVCPRRVRPISDHLEIGSFLLGEPTRLLRARGWCAWFDRRAPFTRCSRALGLDTLELPLEGDGGLTDSSRVRTTRPRLERPMRPSTKVIAGKASQSNARRRLSSRRRLAQVVLLCAVAAAVSLAQAPQAFAADCHAVGVRRRARLGRS